MPQRLTSISGFGLVRLLFDRGYVPSEIANETSVAGKPASDWQHRYLSLEGAATLMWYTDESQLYPESFAAVTSEPQHTGESLPSDEKVLRMEVNVGSDGRVATLEIAVLGREMQIWQSILAYHIDEAEEFGTLGTTTTFRGNRSQDHDGTGTDGTGTDGTDTGGGSEEEDTNLLIDEHMNAVVSISLKGQSHSLALAMNGDAEKLSQEFVAQRGLHEGFCTTIEIELLRAQLELYRSREGQLLKQFAKVQRKVHGIVVAEAHASMAESLAAELTEAMSKVREKIVPDLQAKVKTLEARCASYEQATNDAQTQQAKSENSYIAENVRLKQELQHERHKRSRSTAGGNSTGISSPNKASSPSKAAVSPIADSRSPHSADTSATSNNDDLDSILGNFNLGSSPLQASSYSYTASSEDAAARCSAAQYSHVVSKQGRYDEEAIISEVQELRKNKVALLKQLRSVQDELNVTKYELAEAFGKKAVQRKFLNFNDVLEEPKEMTNTELRIRLHKQRERIDSLNGLTHAMEKERDSAIIRAEEFAAKLEAVESRYSSVCHKKNHAAQQLVAIQGEYDIKTVKKLENENHRLKEEVVKFRGDVLRLQNKVEQMRLNPNPNTASDSGEIERGDFSSSRNSPAARRSVLVIDPSSSPQQQQQQQQRSQDGAADSSVMTPLSALLRSYPMANTEAKEEGNGSTMSNLFEEASSSGVPQSTPFPQSAPFSSIHAEDVNGPVADALNSRRNDTSVKWNPVEKDALAQRLSPVVEDRLLRIIYHRYVHEHKGPSARDITMANLPSASNGASSAAFAHAASAATKFISNTTMTLGRFIRFAKEFHLCFVGGSASTITCTPPYLVSGEIDVIFHNAAKMKVPGDVSTKQALRPYGFRAGGGTDKQYDRAGPSAQTTGLSLTVGQFIEAVKSVACKLYANVIELQTGTVLDCLPPRQRKAAARAVFDVLIKKKLLPISDKLSIVPWPLIYLEQSVNVFGEFRVAQQCLSSHFPQLILWFDHYKTTYAAPSASALALNKHRVGPIADGTITNKVRTGITFKSIAKFAQDFGIIPYLLKEPELYGLFQEFMLWSSLKPEELHKSMPLDTVRTATHRDHGIDEEEKCEFLHFGSNHEVLPFGMSPSHSEVTKAIGVPKPGSQSPGRPLHNRGETRINSNTTASTSSVQAPGKDPVMPLPLSCGLPKSSTSNCRLGLLSFSIFFAAVAQQAFPNHAPEHRVLKMFEICAQSGGDFAGGGAAAGTPAMASVVKSF